MSNRHERFKIRVWQPLVLARCPMFEPCLSFCPSFMAPFLEETCRQELEKGKSKEDVKQLAVINSGNNSGFRCHI